MNHLQSPIQKLIESSRAEFGVSIVHLESDNELHISGDAMFPLCSVLKIPVLCEAFRQMQDGAFTLEDRWELDYPVKNIGSGILTYLKDGLNPTVYDLLLLMIIISDNTATDMVIRRLGLHNIDALMKRLGLADIHIAMSIRDIFDELVGSEAADPARLLTDLGHYKEPVEVNRSGRAYSLGPDNDVGTPRDLSRLLAMIYRGQVVSRSASDNMLHILLQQQLKARLPRFLPEGIPFAHKTGTLAGIRNDAGILYASTDAHFAISVCCRWDAEEVKGDPIAQDLRYTELDSVFGHIARLVYDYAVD